MSRTKTAGTQLGATVPLPLDEDELDRGFGALSDPTRRAILARLASGDAGVLEVAAPFDMSQPAISKHLKVLEEAGLISRHRHARLRLCRLEPGRLRQLSDWVESYRAFWEESFERLDDVLEELQAGAPTDVADAESTPGHDASPTPRRSPRGEEGR
jgi:DNA-binding transcriptional ArsR family regulator